MRTLLGLVATLGLVGCVGGIDNMGPSGDDDEPPPPPPPASGTAREKFDTGVYPAIAGKCITCHKENATAGGAPASSGFVAPTAATGYDVILQYPNVHGGFAANAKILTYVTVQAHQGVNYDPAEITAIEDWLATELVERGQGGGGTPPPPDGPGVRTEKLLNDFSACMTIENFNAANMAQGCGDLETNNNAECDNCHSNGGERFVASRLAGPFFERVSTNRTHLQKYFQVVGLETPTTAKLEPNLPLFEAVLSGTGRYFQHERVNNTPTNNSCTQAMQAFYTATMEKVNAGVAACGPSKLID